MSTALTIEDQKTIDEKFRERFCDTTFFGGPRECWKWIGLIEPTYGRGYVRIWHKSVAYRRSARRVALECFGGLDSMPEQATTRVTCEYDNCVNPRHIEIVEHSHTAYTPYGTKTRSKCRKGHDKTIPGSVVFGMRAGKTIRLCVKCEEIKDAKRHEKRREKYEELLSRPRA